MLKETGVIAVAGFRRFGLLCWAIVCVLLATIFIGVGILKLLGLIGAMSMLTIEGMVPAKHAAQNATIHIIFMLINFALGGFFVFLFRTVNKTISVPFERDIVIAAEFVNDVENNAKSSAKSLREVTRSAISEAKNRGNAP